MSTLHTNSAPETLTRLRNMGVPSFNIATSVNLVIAQRLARRLCSQCKAPVDVPKQSLIELGFTEQDLANPDLQIFQPIGCAECREGYKGRVGIYEVMKVTPAISQIIMEDGNALQIAAASEKAFSPASTARPCWRSPRASRPPRRPRRAACFDSSFQLSS